MGSDMGGGMGVTDRLMGIRMVLEEWMKEERESQRKKVKKVKKVEMEKETEKEADKEIEGEKEKEMEKEFKIIQESEVGGKEKEVEDNTAESKMENEEGEVIEG